MALFFTSLILFSLSALLIGYSYVIFPWLLSVFSRRHKEGITQKELSYSPPVTVIISAFNEEVVLEKKIRSIVESDYPSNRIEILIGSDASTDKTNAIVKDLQKHYPSLKLAEFATRRGKPAVVNDLVNQATSDFLILTDANVVFDKNMMKILLSNFKVDDVGLVGANILNIGLKKDGISIQEKSYIERENLIKYREGLLWGCMMGPFGGCFAIRKKLFENIPEGFLVDDFYLAMKVMEKKHKCINDLQAICYEDVSNDIRQEYKRKSRISAGNFQNLVKFRHILFQVFSPQGFCFFSHKFLRWITPFLILISLLSLLILSAYNLFFLYLLIAELLLLLTPVLDWLLKKAGLHFRIIRFISYFSYMNLALLKGFFRYIKGIDSGIWTPTKRS